MRWGIPVVLAAMPLLAACGDAERRAPGAMLVRREEYTCCRQTVAATAEAGASQSIR